MTPRAVLVTGASTGIGLATAVFLAARGFRVYGGVRRDRDGERLEAAGIPHSRINEPDEPYNGQLMALGLPPAYKSTYRRFISNLPLIK